MTIRRYTLSKAERLSRKRDIDLLFAEGQSFIAYPLRVVYTVTDEQRSVPASILISVSKRNSSELSNGMLSNGRSARVTDFVSRFFTNHS